MKKLSFLLFCLTSLLLHAQTPGDVVQNFGTFPGFNDSVFAIAVQPDGKIILAGNFTAYKGNTENRIIRLNADGTKDTSFNTGTGFNNTVSTIEIQTDGKILVGGNFTSYNGSTENRIIRLNSNGTEDTSFNVGAAFNDSVAIITKQTDGKILVGGSFTNYKGVTESLIIRLNTDGTKDTNFTTGTGFNSGSNSGYVQAIVVQSDGKILVGGNFITYRGVTQNSIIRLNDNGTKDTTFDSGSGIQYTDFNNDIVKGSISKIVLQTDGKILVGGYFTFYKGGSESNLTRLNSNGSKDTSFSVGGGFDNSIYAILAQSDGKILVGGLFTTYKGSTQKYLIRLNTDGNKDTSFDTGTGLNNGVYTMDKQTNGKILLAGYFTNYNGSTENRIISLNTDGTKDTSFISGGTGFDGSITSITTQSDGKMLMGGSFSTYNGTTENRIIRLNSNATEDTNFNTGTGFNNSASGIVVQTDGKIVVGGAFTTYKGVTENRIIRLNSDGNEDTTFNAGTGFNGNVSTIAIQADGNIVVGGGFTTYKGVTENRIIRLTNDGTKDTNFNIGTGFNNLVTKIAIQTDGKIIVGGSFTTYKGVTENRIIRLNSDGTEDTSFNTGTGFNSNVNTIAVQSDGKILVGGPFTSYNGVAEKYIIRLNSDGTKDTTFNTGTGFNSFVYNIVLQADNKILVGGYFTTYNGSTENYLVRLNADGTEDTSFITGTGFNSFVSVLAIKTNGQILAGGSFTTYKGNNSSAIAIGLYPGVVSNLGTSRFDDSNSFVIYPNPVQDVLNIETKASIKSVEIYSLLGNKILSSNQNSVSVAPLSAGTYLAKITDINGATNTQKFIKK